MNYSGLYTLFHFAISWWGSPTWLSQSETVPVVSVAVPQAIGAVVSGAIGDTGHQDASTWVTDLIRTRIRIGSISLRLAPGTDSLHHVRRLVAIVLSYFQKL
ncbi:hypothetical protein LB504_010487 [Fusarium proliferatum]|nr:hypothetical protein LB504_010487 [Fusarium proliferatum]